MIVSILVYDPSTDQLLIEIPESGEVPYSLVEGRPLTFVVEIDDPVLQAQVGSVRLSAGGVTRVESVAPYALFGDENGDFLGSTQYAAGMFDFKVELFSLAGAKGTRLLTETRQIDFADAGNPPEPQPEPEPEPQPEPGIVTVSLIDAATDGEIAKLQNGSELDLADLFGRDLTFSVGTGDLGVDGAVGSVRLTFSGNGETITRTEGVAPYALFGDSNGDFFGGRQIPAGDYTIKIEAFSGANGTGASLVAQTLAFSVTGTTPEPQPEPEPEPEPTPEPGVVTVSLIDATTDGEIAKLQDGAELDLADLFGRDLTFSVGSSDLGVEGTVGSVRLTFSGNGETITRTESVAPFALFGDSNGDFFGGRQLPAGDYTIKIEAFSGANGTGASLVAQTLNFSVTGTAPEPQPEPEPEPQPEPEPEPGIVSVSLIDAATDGEIAKLQDGAELDVADVFGKDLTFSVGSADLGLEDAVGSVRLTFTGAGGTVVRTESAEPFALFGDKDGDFFGGTKLANGDYSLQIEIFSGAGASGTKLGTETLSFSVSGEAPAGPTPPPAPTPDDGAYYAGIADGNNYRFKIQVEDAGHDPGGKWAYVFGTDAGGNQAGAQGGYYVYGDEASTSANGVNSAEILEYRIFVPEEATGSYTFYMRTSRDKGGESDRKNDLWLDIERESDGEGIESLLQSTNHPETVSNGFIKAYGAQYTTWKSFNAFDGEPNDGPIKLDFSQAGFYTVKLAGRSQGLHLDSFELVKGPRPSDDAPDSPLINDDDGDVFAEILAFAQFATGPSDQDGEDFDYGNGPDAELIQLFADDGPGPEGYQPMDEDGPMGFDDYSNDNLIA